ncbi:MAG: UDP-glucose dehydrogenase family protein [Candidatus Omnitrophota bacterium]
MKIGVIGSGYVGLVTGTCFAHLGNEVICVDNNAKKIAMLKKGKSPIYEPGLSEMIRHHYKEKRLRFTESIAEAVAFAEVLFICVNTPPKENGEADLSFVENVCHEIARHMKSYRLIVEKSTVPVETGFWVQKTIKENRRQGVGFDVASNPEFLREGSAISDFLNPDRIVVGVSSKKAETLLRKLYKPLKAPLLVTDIKSAELIKHASNSFLASKISFINMVARICDEVGADVDQVAKGMGMDPRIGSSFLKAGIGFGGFCFPKDLAAFLHMSEKAGHRFDLLSEVLKINEEQQRYFVAKVRKALWNLKGKTIAILGLAFKPDTDDMRFAPSIEIIRELQDEGCRIQAYDPEAMERAREELKSVTYAKTPYEAVENADALLVLTEWKEFSGLDYSKVKKKMRHAVLFDARNMFDAETMRKIGFRYYGIGRCGEELS